MKDINYQQKLENLRWIYSYLEDHYEEANASDQEKEKLQQAYWTVLDAYLDANETADETEMEVA